MVSLFKREHFLTSVKQVGFTSKLACLTYLRIELPTSLKTAFWKRGSLQKKTILIKIEISPTIVENTILDLNFSWLSFNWCFMWKKLVFVHFYNTKKKLLQKNSRFFSRIYKVRLEDNEMTNLCPARTFLFFWLLWGGGDNTFLTQYK